MRLFLRMMHILHLRDVSIEIRRILSVDHGEHDAIIWKYFPHLRDVNGKANSMDSVTVDTRLFHTTHISTRHKGEGTHESFTKVMLPCGSDTKIPTGQISANRPMNP
jgi:hypothetical protein